MKNQGDIERILRDIIKRGNSAEVRRDKDGKITIFEIEKKKRYIEDV